MTEPDEPMNGVPDVEKPPAPGDPDVVLDLLAEGVPMALIADLADPAGPPSPVILEEEGMPDEAWWVPEREPATPAERADDDVRIERDE